jgi:transcriptional regulator with XRE-family HTH domain
MKSSTACAVDPSGIAKVAAIDPISAGPGTGRALGLRIRNLRIHKGMSLREAARRANISPSLISQIERGKAAPSVKTLYALVDVLMVPIAQLFAPLEDAGTLEDASPMPLVWTAQPGAMVQRGPIQDGNTRRSIRLEHGFRWECLTQSFDPNAQFIELIIDVGGGAEREAEMKTHRGREYGVVLKGRLGIAIAFDTYTLESRDSISFDSNLPHSMWNAGTEPMHAIWFEFGNGALPVSLRNTCP